MSNSLKQDRSSFIVNRRRILHAAGGMAGILAFRQAPVFAQAQAQKMVIAHMLSLIHI